MARSARPNCVRRITYISTAISANDRKMMPSSMTVRCRPATSITSSGTVPCGKRRLLAPKMPWAPLFRMMPTPMVAIMGIKCGALRLRSGLSTR
ncbi:hypothetical protein D3C78_1415500 [compost metagenome]